MAYPYDRSNRERRHGTYDSHLGTYVSPQSSSKIEFDKLSNKSVRFGINPCIIWVTATWRHLLRKTRTSPPRLYTGNEAAGLTFDGVAVNLVVTG